jgi:murein DD-endopeptidase MepM/ murein hydrolase activator NlpD
VRRPLLATFVVLLALGAAGPAGAQTNSPEETIRDAQERREQVKAEQAERARDLDVLKAEDDELLAALTVIDEQVVAQEARVTEAERNVAAARAELARLRDDITRTRSRMDELRAQTRARAAHAFVGTERDSVGTFLGSADPNVSARRRALLRFATLASAATTDELRQLDDDLGRLTVAARQAEERAVAEETARLEVLAVLEENRAIQESIRAQLAGRIAQIEAQLADMESQQAELSELIRTKQAEIAAREQARRRASAGSVAVPMLTNPSQAGMIWPTQGRLSSGFGYRRHPILGYSRLHQGLDIGNASGTSIWAAAAGTVIHAGWRGGYGNSVIIDHGGGVATLYAHMSRILAAVGTTVERGDPVGLMGSTGLSTGPHLHFEVRLGGNATDPLPFLP